MREDVRLQMIREKFGEHVADATSSRRTGNHTNDISAGEYSVDFLFPSRPMAGIMIGSYDEYQSAGVNERPGSLATCIEFSSLHGQLFLHPRDVGVVDVRTVKI